MTSNTTANVFGRQTGSQANFLTNPQTSQKPGIVVLSHKGYSVTTVFSLGYLRILYAKPAISYQRNTTWLFPFSLIENQEFPMSNVCVNLAWSTKTRDHICKLVLVRLSDRANQDFECWSSIELLAEECSIGISTAYKKLKILANDGWIAYKRFGKSIFVKLFSNGEIEILQWRKKFSNGEKKFSNGEIPLASPYKENPPRTPLEPGTQPKNGNGNGNGNTPPLTPRTPPLSNGNGNHVGTPHLCPICDPPHEWMSSEEFDDRSYELACPDFRNKLKSTLKKAGVLQ